MSEEINSKNRHYLEPVRCVGSRKPISEIHTDRDGRKHFFCQYCGKNWEWRSSHGIVPGHDTTRLKRSA